MIDFPSFKITQDKNRDYQGVILTGGRPIMTWTIHQNPPWSRIHFLKTRYSQVDYIKPVISFLIYLKVL